jgi:hypothetical protein
METIQKSNKLLIVVGQFSLVLGILSFISNIFFLGNNYYIHFITGILLGLSLVINLTYLSKLK